MSESKYQNPTLFDKTKKYVVSQLKDGFNVLPKLNAQNLYGFNLGNGIWEKEDKITLNIGDGFTFDENGKIIPDNNKLVFINEEGKISADLIPSENLNYKEGVKINFTSSNSNEVTWDGSVATFTHGLNCYPIVAIYDNNMTQALYGVKILDGNRVSIDFTNKSNVTGTWIMIVNYGASYSN